MLPIIQENSQLKELCKTTDNKQKILVSGIVHSVEICSFSYARLISALLENGQDDNTQYSKERDYSLFIDAWSIVDAADVFRQLIQVFIDSETVERLDGAPILDLAHLHAVTEPVRELRNIADHLATRINWVVSHCVNTYGVLSYVRPTEKGFELRVLAPGFIKNGKISVPPVKGAYRKPFDDISLNMGNHNANLSEVLYMMNDVVLSLETLLTDNLSAH